MNNIELFRLVIERGFNRGDLSVADEVCTHEFSEHQYLAPTDLPGPENLKVIIQSARGRVHGLTLTIEDIASDGDKVWARMVARGSDARSGKTIEMSVMDVCRFEDGMMVEHWGIPDRFAMLHQIGALPEPSEASGGGIHEIAKKTTRSRNVSDPPKPARERSEIMTIKPEKTAVPYARRASLEDSRWSLGCLFTVLADSRETGGQFGLIESLSPKGAEPPRHIHSREDEAFHLLEGEITFYIGDETYEATPGTFVFAPRGVPHSYTFETAVIRMPVLITPGGFGEFFRDPRFSEPARELTLPPPEGPPDVARMAAALGELDVEVVGPPGPPQR